ncbi:type II secretory pathway protein [Sphingomonas sp. Leaf412]|uniref:type II secretion system minor pseudopilin GspK n=1 Tax=Sphingomonas sp. Leaf412 TaxID=1736370 RepID=UPI0006F573F7|nr:type II secretion system minor pseudopilin GspK [Sphingomonas sp. Leaf412]KQT32734.1 type II secretory pathway protein [Sphingomonas sp. Leaf412]
MPRRTEGERGAALLTVLLLVAVIAVMAGTALERLRLSTRLAANAVAIDRARGYAYAAETLATTRVTALLRRSPDRVALYGGWSGRAFGLPVLGGTATARVVDGGNCFNLNGLVTRTPDGRFVANPLQVLRFARLIRVLNLPDGDRIAAATADFIDSDDVPLPGGAEDGSYRGRRTAGTLLADPSELRAVDAVSTETWVALRPWLCTLPLAMPSVININTVLPEQAVLLAMLLPDGARPEQLRALLLRRPEQGYASTDAFWNQLSLGGAGVSDVDARQQTSATTTWFRLTVDVAAEGSELHEQALIDARRLPARLVSRQWGDAP